MKKIDEIEIAEKKKKKKKDVEKLQMKDTKSSDGYINIL